MEFTNTAATPTATPTAGHTGSAAQAATPRPASMNATSTPSAFNRKCSSQRLCCNRNPASLVASVGHVPPSGAIVAQTPDAPPVDAPSPR